MTSQTGSQGGSQGTSQTDQLLKQTELGEVIANNKGLFIGLIVAIIVGLFGYGIYQEQAKKSKLENAKLIFKFKGEKFESFKKKQLDTQSYITELKNLKLAVKGDVGILPLILESVKELEEREKGQLALDVLNISPASKNPYSEFFVINKRVELLEDMGKFKEALDSLSTISPQASQLLEEKVFLDKGRLNMKMGNFSEAKRNFEIVTGKVGQEEFVKLSRIYLQQIKEKTGAAK